MKKQLIIGIVVMLLIAGLSGCNEETKKPSNPLIIYEFQVIPTSILKSESANLTWNVTGATTVSIDNNIGFVNLNGTQIIQPIKNTTYTLTAKNLTNTIKATTEIIVIDVTPLKDIPDISWIQNDINNTITVDSISESGLNWANIQITGTAIKPTGTIEKEDKITKCSGTVIVFWKSTALPGTWYFPVENATAPNITFDKTSKRIIVSNTDPGLDWNDFQVIYEDLTLVLFNAETGTTLASGDEVANEGTIIMVGDYIFAEDAGILRLWHKPTNSFIYYWIFN